MDELDIEVVKHVEPVWHDESAQVRCIVETFITNWEDFAYGYFIEDASEEITSTLDDLGIEYIVHDEEI